MAPGNAFGPGQELSFYDDGVEVDTHAMDIILRLKPHARQDRSLLGDEINNIFIEEIAENFGNICKMKSWLYILYFLKLFILLAGERSFRHLKWPDADETLCLRIKSVLVSRRLAP